MTFLQNIHLPAAQHQKMTNSPKITFMKQVFSFIWHLMLIFFIPAAACSSLPLESSKDMSFGSSDPVVL